MESVPSFRLIMTIIVSLILALDTLIVSRIIIKTLIFMEW